MTRTSDAMTGNGAGITRDAQGTCSNSIDISRKPAGPWCNAGRLAGTSALVNEHRSWDELERRKVAVQRRRADARRMPKSYATVVRRR